MNARLLIRYMLHFPRQSITIQPLVAFSITSILSIEFYDNLIMMCSMITMTDSFAGFIWIACLIFIGAMICLLCYGICYRERHETLVVSSHIPDCLSTLNFEINDQLEDDNTAS